MELGIYSFGDATPDPQTGRTIGAHERIRRLLDEIELADRVGLDVYGVGSITAASSSFPLRRSCWPPRPRAPSAFA